uniref:Mesothelin-like protein n=1 Tax=Leptobrachium leishanense TaxID=445787 RepID=A0A8C5WE90_9ANUR
MLKNKSDVYGFLTNLNATIGAKNQTSLPPALSQALLNKTFQLLAANLTSFNNTEWSQLFQNQLSLVLPEVTADQLSVVPPNISCPFFQAVVKGLSDQFPKLKPDKQQQIYKSLIKPYLTQKGSGCTEQVHSSTWISQNLGSFSPIPTFAEITTFNSNFSALDALSSLTPQQVASFAVNSDVGNSSVSSSIIMGTLQNKTDVLNFMTYLNDALTSKNQTSLPPALSQACLNTTFQILAANLTFFNNTEWSQVFQSQLSFALPEITSNQLSTIPQNISCPFFQAVIKDLSGQFPKLTKDKQQQIFKSFIKPFLTQKGSACAANVNSSTWISQNLGNFSQIPTFAELNTLNANFNALDAIPSLTLQQVAGFAVNSGAVNNAASSSIVVGTLKNKPDVFNFITYLNDALSTGNQNSLSPDLSQALFNKTFQVIGNNISAFNSSDWSQLLTKQLNITLIQVTADQLSLIPQNISCDSYHVVIQAFTAQLQNMTVNTQKQVYSSFIKPYLTQKGGKVTCYNQTEANSSAWFVTNMGSFFTHTSDTDLGLFANESTQQLFASDPACMQLASQLDLGKDNSMYYTSLLTSSSGFSLSSLPDKFLCSLSPSAIKNMNSNAAIGLIKKINKQCHNPSSGSAAPAPTPEQIEVATPLVSKLENISSSTLNDLGASAVGLSQTQINSVKDSDLVTSLSSLSNVTGWNIQQCKVIVRKALNGNFKVENMESLGSLASGLPSSKVQELSSTQVANALKNPQFANHLSSAPSCLKSVFASKLVGNYNTPSTLVNNIPSSLAGFIPKSSLNYKSEKPVIQDLINKEWTSDQAAMFFDQVAASETNFTQFSSSVLQGFTCSTPSKLNDSQVKSLAKAMLTQNTLLEEQQLNCLSRQVIKSGIPMDLDKYPKEILWFISSSNYTMGGCVDYFTVVGQSNISILTKGSELRSRLLTQALTCMNVTNTSLTDNHVKVLGQLACDLNATYIENGPSSLLTQLSQCGSFTTVQQNSIGAVIAKGTTVYGQPSKWTRETMTSLGSLNGCLGKSTLNSIPKKAIQSWMKDAFQSSKLSRKQCASMVSILTPTRRRRATGCDAGNEITASNVQNVLLPLLYTVDQLDACLNSSVLVDYLPVLSLMPFTDEQLAVLKKKLDQAYPNGYPESVIPDLGAISFLCTESDIAKWNISSVDTLEGLISPGPPNNTAKLYISKYVDSAKSINGPALNVIGNQYICLLTSAQLNLITATAISEAKPLSISNCNQTVKDALYLKANTSFQSTASQPLAYYNLMKSYLGGAPAADLKNLATKNVSMDIGTFIGLNPEALKGLSVDDVKGLLGTNVVDLKANQDNSVVSAWIKLQKQSDLDRLGLGLQGGIRDVSQTSTVSTISSTTMTTRTNSAPPHGTVLGYSVFFCVVLAVLFS